MDGELGRPAPAEDDAGAGERVAVVSASGEIDLNTASELEADIARAVASADSVCVDLSGCTFIDSTGLRVLLTAARDLRDAGGELAVSGLTGTVERFFSITGLLVEESPLRVRSECPPAPNAYG